MADVEVYIDLDGTPRPVGLLRRHASRREETVTFEYDETWLADDERFSIEPALALTRGIEHIKDHAAIQLCGIGPGLGTVLCQRVNQLGITAVLAVP